MRGCAETMVTHLNAAFARIWTLNKQNNVLELQVSSECIPTLMAP